MTESRGWMPGLVSINLPGPGQVRTLRFLAARRVQVSPPCEAEAHES